MKGVIVDAKMIRGKAIVFVRVDEEMADPSALIGLPVELTARDPTRQVGASPGPLEASCRELLAYVEAERGWVGEPDAEPMVMRGREALAEAERERHEERNGTAD